MGKSATTINEYIAGYRPDVQERLEAIRQVVHEEVPEATEAIKYQMPTFVYHGNLVHFAAWKRHIALYPATTEMEEAIPGMSEYGLSGKGTIQFPNNKPLPLPLIREIVRIRFREARANATGKES